MRRPIAIASLAALAVAVPAAAQDQPAQPAQPAPPAPPAPPAAGQMKVVVDHVGKYATTLTGRSWRVRGDVTPYVAGQQVVVRFFREGKKFLAKRATVKAGASGQVGHFSVRLRAKSSGK